jgi:hypothetical protein
MPFTEAVGLHRYAMEVFDCGAPVGWRLAVAHPEHGAQELWNPAAPLAPQPQSQHGAGR